MKSTLQSKKTEIPKVQDVNFIQKNNGFIKGYSVNTFHGMAKNYNEDRVSIIMNITKPNYKGRWPKCSYFGIFDGHGGSACSDFLKDNMHKYITQNEYFPHKPIEALKQGFKNAQIQFLKLAQNKNPIQRSGSCALVLLVIDQTCYVANVGDSRAILSTRSGKNVFGISRDHKPDSQSQKVRIFQAGGNIYQSSMKGKNGNMIYGPFRIQPGKLSVSRSFGDIEAKYPQFGGNPKVLIAKPQITYFTINPKQHDFIMMGSDGIFDKMQNEQIVHQFWNLQNQSIIKSSRSLPGSKDQKMNQQQQLTFIGKAASKIITKAMEHTSLDNLTTLFIIFQDDGRLSEPVFHLLRNHNSSQVQLQNSKKQRTKSSTHNTKKEQNQQISQFALRRQISRPKINEIPQVYNSFKSLRQEQKLIKSKDFTTESVDKLMKRRKSSHYLKNDEENHQELANRNSDTYNKEQENSHKHVSFSQKSMENKLMNTGYYKTASNNEGIDGSLKRKKSQPGLLKKDSKKQSVWTTITKGIKSTENKVIEKIRY